MSELSGTRSCRLLIVDDEPQDRDAIAQLARAHGCDVRAD
jgi:CheY-like chemotaxis protein